MILLEELNSINASPKKRAYELQSALIDHPYGHWIDVKISELTYPEAYKVAMNRDFPPAILDQVSHIPACYLLDITGPLQDKIIVKVILLPDEMLALKHANLRSRAMVNVNTFGGIADGYAFATFDKSPDRQVEQVMTRFCALTVPSREEHFTAFLTDGTQGLGRGLDVEPHDQLALVHRNGKHAWVIDEKIKPADLKPGMKVLLVSKDMSFIMFYHGVANGDAKDGEIDYPTIKDAYKGWGITSMKGMQDSDKNPHLVMQDIDGGQPFQMLHVYGSAWCYSSSSRKITAFYTVKDHP